MAKKKNTQQQVQTIKSEPAQVNTPEIQKPEPLAPIPAAQPSSQTPAPAPLKSPAPQIKVDTTIPKAKPLADLAETPMGNDNVYIKMRDAYGENIARLDTMTQSMMEERKRKLAEDEAAQKRARNLQFIAGLGDTLSAVANLVGVSRNASNQKQTYSAPLVREMAERDRQERKADMDQLNDRILKMQRDADNAKLAMSMGLAQYETKRRADAEAAQARAAAQAEQRRQFNVKSAADAAAAEENKRQFNEKNKLEWAKLRQNDALNNARKEEAEAKALYWREKNNGIIEGGNKKNGTSKGDMITLSYNTSDGKNRRYDIDKDTLIEVGKRNISVLRDDMAQQAGFKDWDDYINRRDGKGKKSGGWFSGLFGKNDDEQNGDIPELTEAQIKTLDALEYAEDDKDALERIINFYGAKSDKFMAQIENAATGKMPDDGYAEFK